MLLLFLILGVLIGAVAIVRIRVLAVKKNDYILVKNIKYKQLNRPDGKLDYSALIEGIGVDE
ncbi:hypothetical protein [Halocella sp. SP3-1]|uniref:hypothetical protein n=1 Tax=Halocella sp. SP3-1 TaxID=2382161 RepID=UPI000F764677|nr:hypothetical protein [Halocella sp. SP3-1]AZO95251.1 hypothetical protein D7D81_11990 [Halocella sp. SP3-1]